MPDDMRRPAEVDTTDPIRVRKFALFFKRYMSISTIVVAALPIPVTSFGLIPTFSSQTKLLSVYTPLFCFLMLGLLFYLRHQLARIMFPDVYGTPTPNSFVRFIRSSLTGLIPLLLIACSMIAAFQYNDLLVYSANQVRGYAPRVVNQLDNTGPRPKFSSILSDTELSDIPLSSRLMVLYLAIFLFAEAAFILMALKEHLQDLINLSDSDLLKKPKPPRLMIKRDASSPPEGEAPK